MKQPPTTRPRAATYRLSRLSADKISDMTEEGKDASAKKIRAKRTKKASQEDRAKLTEEQSRIKTDYPAKDTTKLKDLAATLDKAKILYEDLFKPSNYKSATFRLAKYFLGVEDLDKST